MRLSVIILAANHGKTLADLLNRLSQQDVTEVIVADAASQDDTIAVARRFGADITRSKDGRIAPLLNAAVRHSSCDVLLFLPGDAGISVDVCNRVLDYLEGHPDAAGGLFDIKAGSSLLGGVKRLFGSQQDLAEIPAFAVLRDVFLQAGGFPDNGTPVSECLKAVSAFGTMPNLRQCIRIASQD